MNTEEAHRHHYVPRLLLRPWLITDKRSQRVLNAYWFDPRLGSLRKKQRGLMSVCTQIDLLSLSSHRLGRDAIEKIFFSTIDAKGAEAKNLLLKCPPTVLSVDQRCDFARLLLSLEARRPRIVEKLKSDGHKHLANALDNDPEIIAALSQHGIKANPSSFVEERLGWSLRDRALSAIQMLVDNPNIGSRLINAHWSVRHISPSAPPLLMSDRPLIRINPYNHPNVIWALPLTPRAAFVAAADNNDLKRITDAPEGIFVERLNISVAANTERFIFSIDDSCESWIRSYLEKT